MTAPGRPWPAGRFAGYSDNQRKYLRIGWNAARETPVPMVLFCPACGGQHIDADNENEVRIAAAELGLTGRDWEKYIDENEWSNPPHKTHRCEHCRDEQGRPFQWRPADVATVGVRALETAPTTSYVSDLTATRAAQYPSLRPADATAREWVAAVRQVMAAARGDKFLEHIPSTWLDAMRNILRAVP